jgi:hypothetical protein
MALNYPFDGSFSDFLPNNLRWLVELQERIDASVRPLGNLQKGVEAAMRMQRLTEGLPRTPAWLDSVGLTNAAALSQRVQEAFKAYDVPIINVPDLSGFARQNTLLQAMPPAVTNLVANLERVQNGFFQNWAGLALAIEQPAWLQQIEALQARFEQLLADLPPDAEPATVEEFAAGAALRTAVFELGTEVLADPAAVSPEQIQVVRAGFSAFLTKPGVKDARDWAAWLFACLLFIGSVRDEYHKWQPPTPTVSEVAIQQQLAQSRTQNAMLQMQLAQQQGQVRTTRRPLMLYSRPSGKAPKAGQVPAGTELAITGHARKWLHVSGFDAEGQLQQGWVLEVRLPLVASVPAEKQSHTPGK